MTQFLLTVGPVSRQALLDGDRAAEPEGRSALAVSTMDGAPDHPDALAGGLADRGEATW